MSLILPQPAENVPVTMVRDHLDNIPQYKLPPPYTFRPYQPGDEQIWFDIHRLADQFNPITLALFFQEFGDNPVGLAERQFYLCAGDGEAVGTATAWFNTYHGQPYGQVHWVAIVPPEQGYGLAKPLLTVICNRLRDLGHERAFLITGTARIPAINLYRQFGFVPDMSSPQEEQTWRAIQPHLGKRPD